MPQPVALIVIDSGFSEEALAGAPVLACYDLEDARTACGAPWLDSETVRSFAGDPLGHGSIVLQNLRRRADIAREVPAAASDRSGLTTAKMRRRLRERVTARRKPAALRLERT